MPDQPAATAHPTPRPRGQDRASATKAARHATAKATGESHPGAATSAGFDMEAWVRQSRERQGLSAKVEDPELLAKVAAYLLAT